MGQDRRPFCRHSKQGKRKGRLQQALFGRVDGLNDLNPVEFTWRMTLFHLC